MAVADTAVDTVAVMVEVDTEEGTVKSRFIAVADTVVADSIPIEGVTAQSFGVFPMDHWNFLTGGITSFSMTGASSDAIMTDSLWWLLRSA